jgi:hypothetical protein
MIGQILGFPVLLLENSIIVLREFLKAHSIGYFQTQSWDSRPGSLGQTWGQRTPTQHLLVLIGSKGALDLAKQH